MKKKNSGKILIISSPSGGGKTSICRKLLSTKRKKDGWSFSISCTTRKKRIGEQNGREYFFVNDEKFNHLIKKNYFAEHFKVHLYHYGTPRKNITDTLKKGGVLLLDIDVQGALKIKKEYPESITVFILPPSKEALRQRLTTRGTETKEQLKVRFENAKKEMKLFNKFEYTVINDELKSAVEQVLSIINCHECRSELIGKEQIKKIIG
ncbi:MAG: guanylate kinase [Candidatus Zixiibacteriota bacterium]|nr:MAG: guanylate kinase [candidate division Zixibacteria bacterium]